MQCKIDEKVYGTWVLCGNVTKLALMLGKQNNCYTVSY